LRAEPVPLRKAEEQEYQHQQCKDCSCDAGTRASTHRVTRLDDLGARWTPVVANAVTTGSQEHCEHKDDEQDEQKSSQNALTSLLDSATSSSTHATSTLVAWLGAYLGNA
jgi:hypothetical protein